MTASWVRETSPDRHRPRFNLDIPGTRMVPMDDRWLLADEAFAAFLTRPIGPARQKRLDRERQYMGTWADIQRQREYVYDVETERAREELRKAQGELA